MKLWLVRGLIRERRWMFPVALIVLGSFVSYQTYRLLHHASARLAFLTVLDLAIMGLIWREQRALRFATPSPSP